MNVGLILATVVAFFVATARAKAKASKDYEAKQRIKAMKKFAFYYNNIFLRGTGNCNDYVHGFYGYGVL